LHMVSTRRALSGWDEMCSKIPSSQSALVTVLLNFFSSLLDLENEVLCVTRGVVCNTRSYYVHLLMIMSIIYPGLYLSWTAICFL